MNSFDNHSGKNNSEAILTQKTPEISLESNRTDQSTDNMNSFLIENLYNEASEQNDLDLILSQDNLSNENSMQGNLPKTNSQLFEENQKLISENQKLKSLLLEIKKNQNISIVDSLKLKIDTVSSQLQNITKERDELREKVLILTSNNEKELQDKESFPDKNPNDQINNDNEDSKDHLISIKKLKSTEDNNFITIGNDPDILKALGLFENVISSQSNEIAFISMQKFALFELLKKLIESHKELENQLQDSIHYASEFEKNHIELEKKCIELQDKTDNEMDNLLSSIISISTNYISQKRINKKKLKTIFESLSNKIQQKLTKIQDFSLDNQIIELFKLILNDFYDTADDLIKTEPINRSLIFPSIINDRQFHTKREIALLGHLENAIKYIQDITKTSQMSLREDERTCVIAQVSRISSFINDEIDPEIIKDVASIFDRSKLESQILTFFDFIRENDESDSEEDKNEKDDKQSKKTFNYEDDDDDVYDNANFRPILKTENSFVTIKNTPIRELYNLFKATLVVNSIMFDHFDRAAEDIVHLKRELSIAKEGKIKYETQYNKIAEQVDEMSSELGKLFYSIHQQQQQEEEKKKKIKNNKNSKSKKRKNTISSSDLESTNENAYADDPFQSVSELIRLFVELKEQNNSQEQAIKKLKRNVNELSKKEKENSKFDEFENQILQLKSENTETKEKLATMNDKAKENIDLKNEVSNALKKVEMLQVKLNKMNQKKKEEENKLNIVTQQLQISQTRNQQLGAQFNNLKEIALKSANIIKSYKEKEKKFVNRILVLENLISQNEINEETKQREINKVKKIQMLQSKQNEETKEKYELKLKELNHELQSAHSKIIKMEEEATASAKSKDNLQRDVAKLKLAEKTLEMKLKQQEAHSLSIANIERGKCESKIMMAKSQMEECLSEHEKRLENIKTQLLQIVREFFPDSYSAAVASSTIVPSVLSTETTAVLINNAFSRSPIQQKSESEISVPQNQFSPSFLDSSSSNPKNDNFSSPHSPSQKLPIFSFLSFSQDQQPQQPQQQQQQQQQQTQSSIQQFSSPATVFSSVSNAANQVFHSSSPVSSHPMASLDRLCDSVEASLDSVRTCVSRSDFHNNVTTVQEANKVRAQLGLKPSASLLKKFDEMREKIEELETEKSMYKAKYEKCIHEKRIVERELSSGDSIRNELRNWEQWGQLLFRQINDETAVVSASASSSSTSSSNSSNLMKNLNDSSQSLESDFLELNDLMTQSGAVGKKKKKTSPFKIIPLITNDEIRAALQESVLASIGHRAMLRKISILRAQKLVIDRAYQNLFEMLKPFFNSGSSKSKSKGSTKLSSSSELQLALRNLKKNYGYFFCFMLNSNVRFCQLNQDIPNSQYALCSIRHLILIYVFIKRIQNFTGFVPLVAGTSFFLSGVSNENEKRSALIELDD